jgi:hypothetical protein
MKTYAEERKTGSFETGVEAAVEAILVSPHFLFAVEGDPAGAAPGSVHAVGDLELATRLSLFLWSSIPDEQLLTLAQQNRLHDPAVMNAQITRMLADPRSTALTKNFAGQWLYLRNLDQQRPDTDVFPSSMCVCAPPWRRRPSCSSPMCCNRTAACWISCPRTTPSSTPDWPSITAFRVSTARQCVW